MRKLLIGAVLALTTIGVGGVTAHADPALPSMPSNLIAQAFGCPAGGQPHYALLVNGNYVYFSTGTSRLSLYDISEPTPVPEISSAVQVLTAEPVNGWRITSLFAAFTTNAPTNYDAWPGGTPDQSPDLWSGYVYPTPVPNWAQGNGVLFANVCVERGTPPPLPPEDE